MNNNTDGIAPHQGYEYQILVTVWIGMDLIFRRLLCDHIVVEPASGEDIDANLRVAPELCECILGIKTSDIVLSIQVKLKRSGHWTGAAFRDVIHPNPKPSSHGPAPRIRPLEAINSNPNLRYLLITNNEIKKSDLGGFRVDEIGQLSNGGTLKGLDKKMFTQDASKRLIKPWMNAAWTRFRERPPTKLVRWGREELPVPTLSGWWQWSISQWTAEDFKSLRE